MRQVLLLFSFLGLDLVSLGQVVCPKEICGNVKGKEIYIPKDLQGMDFRIRNLNGAITVCVVRIMW